MPVKMSCSCIGLTAQKRGVRWVSSGPAVRPDHGCSAFEKADRADLTLSFLAVLVQLVDVVAALVVVRLQEQILFAQVLEVLASTQLHRRRR